MRDREKVLKALRKLDRGRGATYKQLSNETGLSVAQVSAALASLSLSGRVHQTDPVTHTLKESRGVSSKFKRALESEIRRLIASQMEAAGSEPMTPDERRDAYSDLRVTLNGKPAQIMGFRNRFGTVSARGVGRADWSWDAIERIVKAGGKFKAQIF